MNYKEKCALVEHLDRTGALQGDFIDYNLLAWNGTALADISRFFIHFIKKKLGSLPDHACAINKESLPLVAGVLVSSEEYFLSEVRGFLVDDNAVKFNKPPDYSEVLVFGFDFKDFEKLLSAIKFLQSEKLKVAAACCVIDDEKNNVRDSLETMDIRYCPLLTLEELKYWVQKR